MFFVRFGPVLGLLTGCSGALVNEKTAIFPDMLDAGDGSFVAFFDIDVGVDGPGRDLRTEIEMNVGGFLADGVTAEAGFTNGLESLPTFAPGSHTGDIAIVHEPDFATCDGMGYTAREDGGCDLSMLGFVGLSSSGAPRVGFIARAFDDGGFSGAPEDAGLTLDVSEVAPE